MTIENAFANLLKGLGMIGNSITSFIQAIFGFFSITIPTWLIGIATIILLLITILAIGRKVGKLILIILVFILISTCSGRFCEVVG